jgi:hypothetical protein
LPYRKLPHTDAARLKALKTLLDNNDIYTVGNRFIDWKTLGRAQPAYDRLHTAVEQYHIACQTQTRKAGRYDKLLRNVTMYVSHFFQVLLMCVERGEIKRTQLPLFGLDKQATVIPNIRSIDGLLSWGAKAIEGEKARVKQGGRPIYNPTIGMVATHYDIFREAYEQQSNLKQRTQRAQDDLQKLRPEVDDIILELWNQIEAHYQDEPPERRFSECRKFGITYYYRRHEEHLY